MTSTDPLTDRYGAPSRTRRLGVIVLAVVVCATFLGWLGWATVFHANPSIASEEIAHNVESDELAWVRVQIDFDGDVSDPECQVRAISHDKAVVGNLTFTPRAEDGPTYRIEIKTTRRATAVEWLGCRSSDQPRFR